MLVNELINAGFYREALALRPTAHRWAARRSSPGLYALVCLNRAEALYNLGRWKRAERLMRALAGRGDELVVHGGLTQLAWIEVNLGNVEVAEGLMSSVDEKTFPRAYRAEPWFTRARIAIAMKDGPGALRFLDESRRRLVRPSSERNERFLRAWALSLAGDEAGALREYEAAASHPYRGQGGDGLVRWGELLFRRGERERAHAAWKLAVERDPQSESARVAQERLAADDQRRPQEEGEASV